MRYAGSYSAPKPDLPRVTISEIIRKLYYEINQRLQAARQKLISGKGEPAYLSGSQSRCYSSFAGSGTDNFVADKDRVYRGKRIRGGSTY
tara:strand:+ start:467 stop:736 length:270 start_codon:yes stop_codon:yes gene_type:complete